MALFNYASKEITLKVVYYGPGLCGKTTNLQQLHERMSSDKKGKLLSLSTDADRTLFFDFMPVQLGKIKDFNIRFQLYTVPGQVRYNATRKLVLKGADAIVFVADSQTAMKDQNVDSFQNMRENLTANNINPDDIPVVLQYNKRDLKKIMSVDDLNADLNPKGNEIIEASAYEGWGVDETFQIVTKSLLKFISKKHNVKIDEEEEVAAPSKDRINISVEDKANRLLEDEPIEVDLAEPAPAPSPSIKQPVEAMEPASAPDPPSTEWNSLLEDGTPAAAADTGSSEWESGGIEVESGEPAVEDTEEQEGGTSELERMLMEEEDVEEGGLDVDYGPDSSVAGDQPSIDELVQEVASLKQQNEMLLTEINKIKEQIRPVLKLIMKKKPVR